MINNQRKITKEPPNAYGWKIGEMWRKGGGNSDSEKEGDTKNNSRIYLMLFQVRDCNIQRMIYKHPHRKLVSCRS